jgi:glycosyltransferase involved in cell wall biosynthesis
MKKTTKNLPKLLVVRGSQPRMAEMNFYSNFNNMKIDFVGDKKTGWVVEDKIPKNINFVDLPLKPKWGIDPVTTLFGKSHAHQSWQELNGLEEYVKKTDVVNISDNFYFYSGQCGDLCAKYNKKLVAITWETIPHHPSSFIPPYSFNVSKVINRADLFIARSFKARDYLLSLGVDQNKIRVIYKGIDLSVFKPTSEKRRDGKIRLLYVGQLVASKGVIELLEAFKMLYRKNKNIELWICARSEGEPLEKKVVDYSHKLPIKWLANVGYDEIPDIFKKCDIYVQPSQDWRYLGILPGGNEWFSYSIMEAMAVGLPVVATGVGGIPEEIGDYNIYVRQKDVASTLGGLNRLIDNSDLRHEIGNKNVERSRKLFDMKTQAKITEEAILNLI